ncbi:PDDEXK nuclease domain-containing protein [Verrucomicrobiaceae bacterium 227]
MTDERHHEGRRKNKVLIPKPPTGLELPDGYAALLQSVKERVGRERQRAIQSANEALVLLYWEIGSLILTKQGDEGWGAKVIDRLSYDLKQEFSGMTGFSPRNLKYMRKFAAEWRDREIVQQAVAQIPWSSNLMLLEKLETPEERLFYARKTLENGWSRNILRVQIESQLHVREGKLTHNFPLALPPPDSDLARQSFKDPYLLDFLGNEKVTRERELEERLVAHIESFLLELGQGFAFVGRQVHLEIGEDDFYIDLLFYHLKLRCYVVIELKSGKFEPGHVSQLNMYLNLVDDLMKHPDDKPTIGLLLVKDRNRLVAEYALSGYQKPIGIAQWEQQLTRALPEELGSSLPTAEAIESELAEELSEEEPPNIQ